MKISHPCPISVDKFFDFATRLQIETRFARTGKSLQHVDNSNRVALSQVVLLAVDSKDTWKTKLVLPDTSENIK